ncbi:hypothetical protein FB451DRAFT_1432520 [Mycena latifolia]|nr:hypothetical protein FB451DRAFT_1432520 [Mycena latifolia]
MKTGFTLFLAASLLVTVTGTPVASAASKDRIMSQWNAERQAVALLESQLAARGQGITPAQREDIARLESQWASRLAAELTGRESSGIRLETDHLESDSAAKNIQFYPAQEVLALQAALTARARLVNAQTGYISVHRGGPDGPFLGFLTADKIVPTRAAATKYAITSPNLPVTQIDVADAPLRMSVAAGPLGEYIGPSKGAFHFARHVPTGELEAGPRWSPELHAFVMTSVFSLNPVSSEITVRWTNPNGDAPRTVIAFARKRVFYTGDVSGLAKDAEVVAFNWVETRTTDGYITCYS